MSPVPLKRGIDLENHVVRSCSSRLKYDVGLSRQTLRSTEHRRQKEAAACINLSRHEYLSYEALNRTRNTTHTR